MAKITALQKKNLENLLKELNVKIDVDVGTLSSKEAAQLYRRLLLEFVNSKKGGCLNADNSGK